jgi:hypothetical protein
MIKILFSTFFIFMFSAALMAKTDSITVNFTYADLTANQVFLSGTFNNWDTQSLPFSKTEEGWKIQLKLPAGYYYYNIIADGNWIHDLTHEGHINDGKGGFTSIIKVGDPSKPVRQKNPHPFPKEKFANPILTDHPEWAMLYFKVLEMAWNKISPDHSSAKKYGFAYMETGDDKEIRQWDISFISAFGIYTNKVFPAMESLDLFYQHQKDNGSLPYAIDKKNGQPIFTNNQGETITSLPLFAWLEWRYYQVTGDHSRLKRVLPVLIKHFEWIEKNNLSDDYELYFTTPQGSGMINLPRIDIGQTGWIDFSSAQSLSALSIANIAGVLQEKALQQNFSERFEHIKSQINKHCWNPNSSFYHDLTNDGNHSPTIHIGGFWPIIAEVSDLKKSEALIEKLEDRNEFWRPHLVPSLPASDSAYDRKGHYWRGAIWGPTNYMVVKGLEKLNRHDLATSIAINHVHNILLCSQGYWPKTENIAFEERYEDWYKSVWECYAPETIIPSTRLDNTFFSRQDFIGVTGIGPVAMLIENILGFELNGAENAITWRINRTDYHGIENLRFKDQKIDLLCTPEEHMLTIHANCEKPYLLNLEWKNKIYKLKIKPRKKTYKIK